MSAKLSELLPNRDSYADGQKFIYSNAQKKCTRMKFEPFGSGTELSLDSNVQEKGHTNEMVVALR